MKTMKRILVILSALVLLVSLVSCDKSGSIKKAFEKENYEVKAYTGDDSNVQAVVTLMGLTEDQKKDIAEYEIIVVNKKTEGQSGLAGILENIGSAVPDAVIVKFPSAGDLKDFMTVEKDGEKDTSAYDKAKEDGKINGNCWFAMGNDAAKEIFA